MIARFAPANPEFEADVRRSFSQQSLMHTLGAAIELVAPGEVHVALRRSAELCQQNGYLHAGVITSIADTACGYAALTLAPAGANVLAVEFKINLLSPARAEGFVARARVLRPGRTLTVSLAEVAGISETGEELVATMLSTIITRPALGGRKD